jgi:hypothetical protein
MSFFQSSPSATASNPSTTAFFKYIIRAGEAPVKAEGLGVYVAVESRFDIVFLVAVVP